MMMDLTSLVLASGAAALLVCGGALLRPLPRLGPLPAPSLPPTNLPGGDLLRKVQEAEHSAKALQTELASAIEVREAQRKEMVELRQRAERQQQASEVESKRLGAELVAEKGRNVEMEKLVVQSKEESKAAHDELEKLRAAAAAGSDAKIITTLQDEIQSLQPLKTKVAAITQERDTARAKVEALERLIEGVRARSRQLSEELKALKKE
jgi:hypothetical protein